MNDTSEILSSDKLKTALLTLDFYRGAEWAHMNTDEIQFEFKENGEALAITLKRGCNGWEPYVRILINGEVFWSHIQVTPEIKQFWSALRRLAFSQQKEKKESERNKNLSLLSSRAKWTTQGDESDESESEEAS